MNLEQLCTSLELSKKLKELGIKQRAIFCWQKPDDNDWYLTQRDETGWEFLEHAPQFKDKVIAAFTAGELGIVLPSNIIIPSCYDINPTGELLRLAINLFKINDEFCSMYEIGKLDSSNIVIPDSEVTRDNEVNSRAKLLVYLIENNIVTIEDINAKI